jgi:hypothetical protein
MDYNLYIAPCYHNRRAFVHCLLKAFAGFSEHDASDFTVSDFHLLAEMLCPTFPRALVLDAVRAVRPAVPAGELEQIKMPCRELCAAVCFHVLFRDWIVAVEQMFNADRYDCRFPLQLSPRNRMQIDCAVIAKRLCNDCELIMQ